LSSSVKLGIYKPSLECTGLGDHVSKPATIAVILVLSLLAWAALYWLYPATPPDAVETTVIVGAVAIGVAGVRWLAARVSRRRRSRAPDRGES
jgi:hypothetical protein